MIDGRAIVLRGDASNLPLPDASVDLIVTSPPYFALRSYTDGGEHYDGQIGSEATPAQWVANLLDCTREWMRVLKPTGSIFVNLGDSFSKGQRYDSDFTAQDAAWLAGVIDSDGSISIRVDNGGRSHVAWTRIGQMRPEVVQRVGKVTGLGQVFQDSRGVWNWNAAAQQARWVLERIWPWLQIKRRQALAAVDLMTQKTEGRRKGKWNPLTDDDLRRRELIRQAVLAWNRGEEFADYEPPVIGLPRLPADPLFIPAKSLIGLPWRYALACTDELGLFLRSEIIWHKLNGLPESVTDRVRRSHEQVFHFTKQPRYFTAVDEIREAHSVNTSWKDRGRYETEIRDGLNTNGFGSSGLRTSQNPLGKLPGSVWDIASQPLTVPAELGVDHFAAFPMELPRRIILGWSPSGICVECGEGRRPVAERGESSWQRRRADGDPVRYGLMGTAAPLQRSLSDAADRAAGGFGVPAERRFTGYACACPEPTAPTRPAVVLDPFGGTGTTALVASVYGRVGISVDRSADYCRLAAWRTTDPGQRAAAMQVERPEPVHDDQLALEFEVA